MDLLIVGASVRAAAASLDRIGCHPIAFDRYGDADLAAIGPSTQLDPATYPTGIWHQVRNLPPMPWLYTGAIENHPDLVEAISSRFRLLGNGPAVLHAVRDPDRVASAVRAGGFRAPAVSMTAIGVPTDGSWLAKPVASGGGEGIKPWTGGTVGLAPGYYQQRVEGRSFSATFVRDDSGVQFVGVTRQYHGRPGNRFAYRGSLGPWTCPPSVQCQIEALGRAVGDSFGLLGIFGIDLIVEDDRAWLIEVNPRYTAAVEVLEHALGRSVLRQHLAAFGIDLTGSRDFDRPPATGPRFAAKVVLSARSKGQLDRPIEPEPAGSLAPSVADIPRAGTWFEVGHPVLTVFGFGATAAECRVDLVRRSRLWIGRLAVLRA